MGNCQFFKLKVYLIFDELVFADITILEAFGKKHFLREKTFATKECDSLWFLSQCEQLWLMWFLW